MVASDSMMTEAGDGLIGGNLVCELWKSSQGDVVAGGEMDEVPFMRFPYVENPEILMGGGFRGG